jgi:hypothetical protein
MSRALALLAALALALACALPVTASRPTAKPCHGHSCPSPTPTATPTATPTPTPTPTGTERIVVVTPSNTAAQFSALLSDMTVDVIELAAGTYHWPVISVNVDRTARPLTVRAVSGASVTFVGDAVAGGGSQFWIGAGGVARYITFAFAGVTFTDYTLGDTGLVWVGNASHVAFNGPTVQNISVNAAGGAIYTWALYLSIDGGVSPSYFVADGWTVRGTGRNHSALQVGHVPSVMAHVYVRGWTVSGVAYSIYASNTVTDFLVDGWTITDSAIPSGPYTIAFASGVSGVYSNIHSTAGIQSQGGMTDGGGNVWN